MPAFTPYLVIRAVGSYGLVQPGRVVGGNNFIPLGNPFAGLENTTKTANQAQEQQKIVQFENDIFCWQQRYIRKYNPATEDWDIVYTVPSQDASGEYGYHSGLHFMHDKDGFPILIGIYDHNGTGGVRIKYGPDSFGVYIWSVLTLTNVGTLEDSNKGIAIYQNQLYKTINSTLILRYDPVTDLAVQQTRDSGLLGNFGEYTDMIVFENRLLHFGQTTTGLDMYEMVGGSWTRFRDQSGSNNINSPTVFEHNGSLYCLYAETSGAEDGWRFIRINSITPIGLTYLDELIPYNFRWNRAAGALGTPAPNYFNGTRSYCVIDQESDPANPRVIILIGSSAGTFEEMTAFEFVDDATEWTKLPGGNLTAEMQFPHNNFGSGVYHWTSGNLNVQIDDVRIISNTLEEIDFIAYGDPGFEDKRVRIYFDNLQELALQPASLVSTNPTSGTVIMTDTGGDFIDGVDADGVTVYTVVRDFEADGAVIGQQEVFMPHIERLTGT